MATNASKLFARFVAALPERRRRRHERVPDLEQEHTRYKLGLPEPHLTTLHTFDAMNSRPISPQQRAWHSSTGMLVEGSWRYLSPSKVGSAVRSRRLKKLLATHREYWDQSAPMQFQNSQPSVFALIGDLSDGDLIYWVWPKADGIEPELWQYFGQSETRYRNLSSYIASILEGS